MEYERFFHFGTDPYAAKWYLIMGSNNVPQRLLCRKEYAVRQRIPHFGQFMKPGTTIVYTYIVRNLFDIPYAELDNFILLACDAADIQDVNCTGSPTQFDLNFKREFKPALLKSIPSISVITNQNTLATDYLEGLSSFMGANQPIDFNLNMNIVPCTQTVTPTASVISSTTTLTGSTCKRKNDSNIDSVQNKQPAMSSTSANRVTIEDLPNDDDIFGDAVVTSNILLEQGRSDFPSVVDDITMEDVTELSRPPTPRSQKLDFQLSRERLRKLGTVIQNSNISQWFGDDLTDKVQITEDMTTAVFMPRQLNGSFANVTNRVQLQTEVQRSYARLMEIYASLPYPTLYNELSEDNLKMKLSSPIESFGEFDSFVRTNGPQIRAIVDSQSDDEFSASVQASGNKYYWLLYGLCRYRKNPNASYTTLMEIVACRFYGNLSLMILSDLYIRAYFAQDPQLKQVTANSVNLHHIKSIALPDDDVTGALQLTSNSEASRFLDNAIPQIRSSDIEIQVVTAGDYYQIRRTFYFATNLLAIDENLFYILTPGGVFLTTRDILNNGTVSQTLRQRYASPDYNVFTQDNYLGLASN